MRICLVGGIFGKSPEYRRVVTTTPETVLSAGLRARGHDVVEQPHAGPYALRGFDVVHVHHLADGALEVAAARSSPPFAYTSHWLRHDRATRRLAARYVVARASAVVALSETEATWQRAEYRGVATRQHVIPNGIDETTFRFCAPRPPEPGAPWRLLFVGQLAAFKGVDVLLGALALLGPTVRTRVELAYHVGTEEASLRNEVERLGLTDVQFLGARSPAELAEDYARAHVLVLPSYGESLPSVISEAMFVGRPVIATDVGGVREQVGDFGQILAPGDRQALAAALLRVIEDYERYMTHAPMAAQRAVERYSVSAMVSAHEQMYLTLIQQSSRRGPLDAALDSTLRAVRQLPRPRAPTTATDSAQYPSSNVRVLHVISRLNVGGAAVQVISLTHLLNERGYQTTLVRGIEEQDEGTMDYLAEQLDVRPLQLPSVRRNVGWHDIRALAGLTMTIARLRPDVVHTHAAKAGALGRLAARIAPGRSGRVLVHTFHGHSLSGYFSSPAASAFRAIERLHALHTTRLVAVSEEIRDDLIDLKVANADSFEVIRCGFDFSPFAVADGERALRREKLRAELGIPSHARVVTLVARLVPIKRVDRFLRVANMLIERGDTYFLVVGDGELRGALESSTDARRLGERLIWTGFRRDIADICFASDLIALTSDNEGTPISLIEALAAGTPVLSTDVGGVAAVVIDGETGLTVAPEAERELAGAVLRLLDDHELARRLATRGHEHVLTSFGLERLIDEHDRLYRRLLSKSSRVTGSS